MKWTMLLLLVAGCGGTSLQPPNPCDVVQSFEGIPRQNCDAAGNCVHCGDPGEPCCEHDACDTKTLCTDAERGGKVCAYLACPQP